MNLPEGGCGVASTSRDFAGLRSLGDSWLQANHKIGRKAARQIRAREQSGRLGLGREAGESPGQSVVFRLLQARFSDIWRPNSLLI